jgi:hypothetical protein
VAAPLPTAKPTGAPTPNADQLIAELDIAWTQGRWADVQNLLNRIEPLAPESFDFSDKRYAAHVAAGQDLLTKGNKPAAVDEFEKAQGIDPNRGEANVALISLTPTPTPVPKPQITSEMRAYLLYMYPRFIRIGPALQTVSDQSQLAGITPAIIFTDTWRVKVVVALADLKNAGLEIQQYKPVPPQFKHLDDLVVAEGKDLVGFTDEYAAGVDNVSAVRLSRAAARLQSAASRSTEITTEIQTIAQQYGISIDGNSDTL